MNKILLTGVLLAVMFGTSGCVKYEYNITIDDNENISFSEIQAVDTSAFGSAAADMESSIQKQIKEKSSEYEAEGYTVTPYSEDSYKGISLLKDSTVDELKISDLPSGFEVDEGDSVVNAEHGLFSSKYSINLTFDGSKMNNNDQMSRSHNQTDFMNNNNQANESNIVSREKVVDEVTGDVTETIYYKDGGYSKSTYNPKNLEAMGNALGNALAPKFTLTIKIPQQAKENNADTVLSNNTYQWNLASQEPVKIILKYEKRHLFAIISLPLILIFIVIFYFIYKKDMDTPFK